MKILCVLYDDPKGGMPSSYPLKELPKLEKYPDGMTLPSPKGRDFNPGELLGCVSGELGLRKFLEDRGHTLVVTSDKDADGCIADKELVDADIVISQPFWPYYLTRQRMECLQVIQKTNYLNLINTLMVCPCQVLKGETSLLGSC